MAATILLIDDAKDRRDAITEILKSDHNLIIETADCAEGLSSLEKKKFDLILLDMTPPSKCGFGILKHLEEHLVASKVMVITGTVGVANIIRSVTPGAREYVTKPYNPEGLLKSIEHLLSDRSPADLRVQVIKAGDFIKSTPTGDLDKAASKEGLAEIAALGADLQGYTVLIDLREVNSRLSTTDIFELASELVKYGETFRRKTAVLARADHDLDQATFFEDEARGRGFNVKAFTIFEEAILWLSTAPQPPEEK